MTPLVRLRGLTWVGAAAAMLLGVMPAAAGADDAPGGIRLRGWGQVGGQIKEFEDTEFRSKYEEYRELPRGLTLDDLHLQLDFEDTPWWLRFDSRDAFQRDARIGLSGGAFGLLRVRGEWDRIPHFFAEGATDLLRGNRSSGNFAYANDGVRSALTSNDLTAPPAAQDAGDAATSALIRSALSTDAFDPDLRIQRDRATGEIRFTPFPEGALRWTLHANGFYETQEGSRAISVGTYERRGIATGDTFRVLGLEMQEPIERSTGNIRFGTDLAGDWFTANLEYEWLQFDDEPGQLTFTNPFNNSDELAVSSSNLNRGRFSSAQLDLAPDNRTHRLGGGLTLRLPAETTFNSTISYAWMRQDDPFLAYTMNSAILATNVPGSPLANSLARPERDLGGDVRVLAQSYTVTNRLIPHVTTKAFYRYDGVHNRTSPIDFPGYAAFGDSAWRTSISTTPPAASEPVESKAPDYVRQDLGTNLVWDPTSRVHVGTGYTYERFGRDARQVARTDEHLLKAWVDVRPFSWLRTRIDYRFGDREARAYDGGDKEYSQLRMFDEASRTLNEVRGSFSIDPFEDLSLSLRGRMVHENYDETKYGLEGVQRWSGGPDVSYTPLENLTFVAYYEHSFDEFDQTSVAKTGGATEATIFNRSNRWTSRTKDRSHFVGFLTHWEPLPDVVLLDLGYDLGFSRGKILTRNPGVIDPTAALSAQAYSFPDTRTRFQEVNATARWRFTSDLDFGLRYVYSRYRLDDFQWNGLSSYVYPGTQENAVRYLFMNARYGSFDTHFAQAFVTWRFDVGRKH